ncbi:hypothetical protein D9M70_550530 [compost metagenome]
MTTTFSRAAASRHEVPIAKTTSTSLKTESNFLFGTSPKNITLFSASGKHSSSISRPAPSPTTIKGKVPSKLKKSEMIFLRIKNFESLSILPNQATLRSLFLESKGEPTISDS